MQYEGFYTMQCVIEIDLNERLKTYSFSEKGTKTIRSYFPFSVSLNTSKISKRKDKIVNKVSLLFLSFISFHDLFFPNCFDLFFSKYVI